jgi:hypothetical protein
VRRAARKHLGVRCTKAWAGFAGIFPEKQIPFGNDNKKNKAGSQRDDSKRVRQNLYLWHAPVCNGLRMMEDKPIREQK